MDLRAVLLTPPAELPVSVSEVKAHTEIDFADDDDLIAIYLSAAVSHMDGLTGILGRAMVTQTWRFSAAGLQHRITVALPDVQSVALTYDDADGLSQTVPADQVSLHPVSSGTTIALAPGYALPGLDPDAATPVRIDVTCGFGAASAVPGNLKVAVLQLARMLYDIRDGGTLPQNRLFDALVAPWRWRAL